MHSKINKMIWFVVILLFIGTIGYIIYRESINHERLETFEKRIYYMDTYIYIKLYTTDLEKANSAMEEVERIYKKYHELTNRYNGYPGLKNIYYIHNNEEENEYLEIDSRLYDILELSLFWYQESDGLFDVRIGNLVDIWQDYAENDKGVPPRDELEKIAINDIILNDGKILNNHPNIDLSGIVKGYTAKKVGEYLDSVGIDQYLINAGGNILVGKHYENDKYIIGIEDPTQADASIFLKVSATEKAIVTKGSYQMSLEILDKRYQNIIHPKTKYPADHFLSVTVISSDSVQADVLSNVLSLMELEDALEFVNSIEDVEAIFYVSKEEQVMSDGFHEYLYE